MNPYKVTTAVFFVALLTGGILGWTLRRPEKCPDQSTLSLRIDSLESQRDSLKATLGAVLNSINDNPVNDDPDTIVIRVRDRARLLRASGVDSAAAVLFADPE
jgi:hypothetical protein